jgi:putative endonuclease
MQAKGGWVYMMTNQPDGVLYIGVTSDFIRRASQHRAGEIAGFTQRYNLKRLVYFERYDDIRDAITREKLLKKWNRAWKDELIAKENPSWNDLYAGIL